MRKETFIAWLALLLLVIAAGWPRFSSGAPNAAASAYLLYTGGLWGQLEPCG